MNRLINFLKTEWLFLTITVGGLLLRLWNLTAISLWHDEAFSALLIKYSWGEMFYRIGLDVHPPMYYVFLRFWHYIFGDSLFALRGMSVLFGVLTILVTYYFVKAVFNNKWIAIVSALLVAVNPFSVQYVTEARMYTMGAFFAVAASWALVCALRNQKEFIQNKLLKVRTKFIAQYLMFILCSAIMIYTHYYLLFSVLALGLYAIWYQWHSYRWKIKNYLWVVFSGILILVSFLPWLKVFLFQYKQVGGDYWIPPINIWSIPQTLWSLLLNIGAPSNWVMILVTVFTLWVIVRVIRKYQEPEKWLILGGFLAPFGGAFLFFILSRLKGGNSSVFLVRYFIFSTSFYLILVAAFIKSFQLKNIRALLVTILVGLNIFSIAYYWQQLDVKNKPGMAAAAKFLQANVQPNHKIYVGSSFEFFNYKYYNATKVRPLLYTDNRHISDIPHYAGTAILTEEDLVLNFKDSTRKGDTIWLLWTNGFGGSKPAVPANWTQIDEQGFAEIRPYVGTWVIVTEYKVN